MAHFGFRYYVVGWQQAGQASDTAPTAYGSDNVTLAKRVGYGFNTAAAPGQAQAASPNETYYQSLPQMQRARYDVTLSGDHANLITVTLQKGLRVALPSDGCTSAARAKLYGDLRQWWTLHSVVTNLSLYVTPRVLATATYRGALVAWQRCMRSSGYQVGDPGAARAKAQQGYSTEPQAAARRDELAIAVADARCSQTTGLVRQARSLDSSIAGQVRQQHAHQIAQYDEMLAAAANRARALRTQMADAGSGH